MEFIVSLAVMFIAIVAMLAINHFIYKREKTLLELVEKYKSFYFRLLDEWAELKKALVRVNNEREAYRKAIDDCVKNFNMVYANAKLSFDEGKCAFVIEDIVSDDEMPTEEEITQHTENNDENQ